MSPLVAVANDRGRNAYKMLYNINIVIKISDQMKSEEENKAVN